MINVPLTNSDRFALIDDEDEPILAFNWCLTDSGYACRGSDHLLMHRAILHAPAKRIVDHRNGDKLDNRRGNLRLTTALENARNHAAEQAKTAAKFTGVIWNAQRSKWQVHMRIKGKLHHLGLFADVEEARRVRAEAEIRIWGVQPQRREALERVLGRTLDEHLV